MSDLDIRQDFIEGVEEVFTTLFNTGHDDGILFYPLAEDGTNFYKENKAKEYLPPYNLVAKVELFPEEAQEIVEGKKETATFTVPVSSFLENDIPHSNRDLDEMRKGLIFFDDTYYEILLIRPRAFVEDIFLLYEFKCCEDLETKEVDII